MDSELLYCIAIIISIILLIIGIPFFTTIYEAKIEKDIINQTYGTNYTTSQIFWSGHVIKELILGNKHRIAIEMKGGK